MLRSRHHSSALLQGAYFYPCGVCPLALSAEAVLLVPEKQAVFGNISAESEQRCKFCSPIGVG